MESTESLYLRWLKGEGLRVIGGSVGVSHSTIRSWFRKEYGDHATDPLAMSLIRSLVSDYQGKGLEDPKEILELAYRLRDPDHPETVRHRSNFSMGQLTAYQVVREPALMDNLVSVTDPWSSIEYSLDFLRLPLVIGWLSIQVNLLCNLLVNQTLEELT